MWDSDFLPRYKNIPGLNTILPSVPELPEQPVTSPQPAPDRWSKPVFCKSYRLQDELSAPAVTPNGPGPGPPDSTKPRFHPSFATFFCELPTLHLSPALTSSRASPSSTRRTRRAAASSCRLSFPGSTGDPSEAARCPKSQGSAARPLPQARPQLRVRFQPSHRLPSRTLPRQRRQHTREAGRRSGGKRRALPSLT